MHITLAHSLVILSIFTCSSAALLATPNLQNPPPPSRPLPAIAIDRRENPNTNLEEHLDARKFAPGIHEGWNVASMKPSSFFTITTKEIVPFQTLTSLPPITEHTSFPDLFLTPTTTIVIPASTIYFTKTAVTITPRDVIQLKSTSAITPLSRALPRTFQTMTITGSPVLASSTITIAPLIKRRDYNKDKAFCEALPSQVLECLESRRVLIPVRTSSIVKDGMTYSLIQTSADTFLRHVFINIMNHRENYANIDMESQGTSRDERTCTQTQ
ncbi:hypothetical protein SBOR_2985 [Sclerotinia borealis F-4128]|uniref:Uncharacterized protein n=1 Tax=Sclerotinia borealis (strain F-4128) TaxID=1432307 RepID=W9CKT2_SCLBF|nr:hypothetical protein SBOR_2985 [Sclerotinia borealis F-4128]